MPLAQINPVGFVALAIVGLVVLAAWAGYRTAGKFGSKREVQLAIFPLVLLAVTIVAVVLRWHEIIEWIVLPAAAFCLMHGVKLSRFPIPRWIASWQIVGAIVVLLTSLIWMPSNTILF